MPKKTKYLGNNIRRLRNASDMTQCALAKRLGVTVGYISQLENDKRTPSTRLLERIASFFKKELRIEIK